MADSILFTGSTGFIGRNLVPFLSKGDNIILSLSLRNGWQENFHAKYNTIIHLAGKAHDTSNISAPEEYFSVNTGLTKQLFDQFLDSPAKDFIFFSSVKAATDRVAGILDENAVANPGTPYGQSKRKAEEYILSHELPAGKRAIILRPCMIHGPGNKGNLNLLFKIVQKGIPWPLAAFDNRRSFLSVDNLCYVVAAIIGNEGIPSGIYNCADDEPLATNEVVELIAQSVGKKARFWHIPERIINGLASAGDTLHLPLNSERLKKLTESYVVSNKKLKAALGIAELPVSARGGLQNTFKSFSD